VARQQLGVKSDDQFVSLREYLEVKEGVTETIPKAEEESVSENARDIDNGTGQ
jgi:hypothetical protein